MLELQEYKCKIRYKRGSLQVVTDKLLKNIEADEIAAFRKFTDQWYDKRLAGLKTLRNLEIGR